MNLQPLNLFRDSLKSNEIRKRIGIRVYDASAKLSKEDRPGIISAVLNIGAKFVGFLVNAAFAGISWTLGAIWEVIIQSYFEIKYFDWNQTDAEIERQIGQNNDRIANSFGQLVASGLVWTAGIAVATGLTAKFPVLSGRVALALTEEGGQELRGQLGNLITTTRQAIVSSIVLGGFLTLRKLRLFGLAPITEERPPWILAEKIEEKVQSIDNTIIRSFTQGFLDQLEESIIEMGYVVAMTVDDYYAAQKAAQDDEPERTIIITPDNRTNDEKLVLVGSQSQLEQSLQTTLATHTLVHNRDIGEIIGQHYDDWYRAKPFRRSLQIIFRDKREPPWVMNRKPCKTVEINIPDPLPGLSWEKIKRACEPFTWGPVLVQQKLDNGRTLQVQCSTLNEGKGVIRRILSLTSANPIGNIRKSEPEQDNLPDELKIRPTLVYPAYGTLIVRDFTLDGKSNTYQKNKESSTRFELWTDQQPENFKNLPG